MKIRMKIYEVFEKERSVEVQFYTDATLADIEPVRAQRTEQLMRERDWDEATARAFAEREYPVARSNITLPTPIPTGQALVDFIMTFAPIEWLKMRDEQILNPVSLDALKPMRGGEYTVDAEVVAPPQKPGAIPVEKV